MIDTSSHQVSTRYDWIDALRAIAILMVIAVHASHGLKQTDSLMKSIFGFGGYGVQLFFVASAITLCMSMQKNYQSQGYVYDYLFRRFFRIAPLYYIGILVYFIWSIPKNYIATGMLAPLPQYTVGNIFANIFLINGFVPAANNNIVPGGWSIGTEVAFYLLFPVLFYVFRGKSKIEILGLAALMLVFDYFLIAAIERFTNVSMLESEFFYFNIASQIQVFIIGMVGYYFIDESRRIPVLFLFFLCIVFWILGFCEFLKHLGQPLYFRLLLISLSFVFLAYTLSKLNKVPSYIKSIGQRSFSMYITHFVFMNVIDYGFNNFAKVLFDHPNIKALLHYSIAVVLCYFVSGYTKRVLEDRFIRLGALFAERFVNNNSRIMRD